MDFIEKLCIKLTKYIQFYLPDKTETELEKIKYGLHVLLNNIIELTIIFTISYLLGIFKYTLATYLSFFMLRFFAAGIHARKFINCLISTMLLFFIIVYTSMHLTISNYVRLSIFIIIFVLVFLYAPADTDYKPIISSKLRKKLKFKSLLVVITQYFFCILLLKKFNNQVYPNIVMLSALLESITITPIIYKILERSYKNYEYYVKK